MRKFIVSIDRFFARIALFFIALYQKTLSPDKGLPSLWLKGRVCTHEPHCSEYAKQCFQRHGFVKGLQYTLARVSSCVPSHEKHYDPSSYSVVFFSGAPIGIPFLQGLRDDARFDVTGVVTMPDAPSGRGMKMRENIIKSTARDCGVADKDIQTPHSLRLTSKKWGKEATAFHQRLQEKKPDFLVVVAYGKIIPQSILDIPSCGPINVHGSLLPEYRGASPLQSVFLTNEKETGITIMRMTAGLDEGDSIDQLKISLVFSMTVADLIDTLKIQGPQFLQDVLWKYGKGYLQATPQDHTLATHTTKIVKEDALIDIYTTPLSEVYNKYRAYVLRPKVYFIHNEKRVIIERLLLDEKKYMIGYHQPLVVLSNDTPPQLHTAVLECMLKPQGKKAMSWDVFIHGYF